MIRRETYSATNRRYAAAAAAIQNEDPCLTYMQKTCSEKYEEKKDLSNAYFFAF